MTAGQMRPETVRKIQDAIVVVEGYLAAIGAPPQFVGGAGWYELNRAFRQSEREAIGMLVRIHGASHGGINGLSETLRFAGVNTTCSSGPSQLLRNWIEAARRRLERGTS